MPRPTKVVLALTFSLAVTACGSDPAGAPASGAAPSSPELGPTPGNGAATLAAALAAPEVLTTGLQAPWGLAFLPGGDALVTERDSARVLRIPAGGGHPTQITRIADAAPGGEGGLLGIAVSPTFAQDQLVFVYVTTEQDNRIVRFRLDRPAELTPVLTGIPRARVHNGGRLAFGPDRLLYAGTGDTGDSSLAQDPRSLGGKVLRMTSTGEPAQAGGTLVFSLGHRNVQGLAFDRSGQLYATEFGHNRFDEVNLLVAGGNYGWPAVEGAGTGGGRFRAPLVTWEPSEASPSGAAVAGGDLYVAALRGERLWQIQLGRPGQPGGALSSGTPIPLLQGQYGRLRAAATAPDGALWVLTSNRDGRGSPGDTDDRILRLVVP